LSHFDNYYGGRANILDCMKVVTITYRIVKCWIGKISLTIVWSR